MPTTALDHANAQLAKKLGVPVRPRPTAADYAKAEKLADEFGAKRGPDWAALHRADAVRQFAQLEMGKRQDAEFRAAIDQSRACDARCLDAVEKLQGLRANLSQEAA